jgi:hypothetical protein
MAGLQYHDVSTTTDNGTENPNRFWKEGFAGTFLNHGHGGYLRKVPYDTPPTKKIRSNFHNHCTTRYRVSGADNHPHYPSPVITLFPLFILDFTSNISALAKDHDAN